MILILKNKVSCKYTHILNRFYLLSYILLFVKLKFQLFSLKINDIIHKKNRIIYVLKQTSSFLNAF
jgi:hypothetical protein